MILFGYHWNDIVKKLSKVGRVRKKYLEEDDYIGGVYRRGDSNLHTTVQYEDSKKQPLIAVQIEGVVPKILVLQRWKPFP